MKKIDALTKKQEIEVEKYYDKWLKIGRSQKTNRSLAEKAVRHIYSEIGLASPAITWFDCPLCAKKYLKNESLGADFFSGNHDAGWLGFRDFFAGVMGVDFGDDINLFKWFKVYSENSGWMFPFENHAFLCNKNKIDFINDDVYKIYYEGCSDFKPIYIMNNVIVPEKLYVTSPENLELADYFKETNVEIRREFFRKIGASRFLKESKSKLIDTWIPEKSEIELVSKKLDDINKYELYEIEINSERKSKYLKMQLTDKNGLTSVYLERIVDQTCDSAKKAFYQGRPWLVEGKKIVLS